MCRTVFQVSPLPLAEMNAADSVLLLRRNIDNESDGSLTVIPMRSYPCTLCNNAGLRSMRCFSAEIAQSYLLQRLF